MSRKTGTTKGKGKVPTTASGPPTSADPLVEEAVADLPDREVMSLLPSGLGSLTGAGLGGGLLGSGTGTQPVTTPATPPPLPTGSIPLPPADSLAGADQAAPIAQESSST